jgi:hypothetical protein
MNPAEWLRNRMRQVLLKTQTNNYVPFSKIYNG